jgi:hypothetical protein
MRLFAPMEIVMDQPDVEKLIQQTRQYEFADGLRDLQLAVLLTLGGVAVWLSLNPVWMMVVVNLVNRLGRWAAWLNMLPLVLVCLAGWGMLRLMDTLRRRWLWRESGMVKPSRWMVPRLVTVLSALILLGGLALGFGLRYLGRVGDDLALRMLWAATGWSFGYTLVGMGQHVGLRRYVWLGGVGGVLSTALLFLPLAFGQAGLAFGLLWGLLLAASGAVVLRRAFQSVPGTA